MNMLAHIARLMRITVKARERSAAIRLNKALDDAGMHLGQHRTATRCRALGRTIKQRRQVVTEMLRRDAANA